MWGKVLSEDAEGHGYAEERHQILGRRRDDDINLTQCSKEEDHRQTVEKDSEILKRCPLDQCEMSESA